MDIVASPAMLGGLIMTIALGAWALGRWQGAAAAAAMALSIGDDRPAGAAVPPIETQQERVPSTPRAAFASPCQQDAADERRRIAAHDISLGELHEEVSAYRRREQVLASVAPGAFQFERPAQDCRFVGLTGEPACPAPANVRQACGAGCTDPASPRRPDQPSRAVLALVRV